MLIWLRAVCSPVRGSVSSVSGVSVAAFSSGKAARLCRTVGAKLKKTEALRFFPTNLATRM
ncbi:MAG: hypothetical protein WCS52_14805 [bacterium]